LPPHLADIQPIMDTMLAKDPADRFQSCLEFCKALQNLPVIDRDYATELEGATRIYDPSQLSSGSFGTGRQSGQISDRHSGQFSDRHSGQFSDRHSGQFSDRTSGRFTGRTDAAASGAYEATRMMTGQQGRAASGALKKYIMFGVPALLLVLAIGLYFAIWYVPSSGLSDADQRRVENYLRRVDANLLKLQIDSPPEDNAVYELQRALALAPGYRPTLDRARQIAEFYETDARDLIDANKPEEALEEIKKGLEVDPDYTNLVDLEDEIATMLAAQKRQAEITEALRVAADYQSQGMLIEPPNTNAYAAFKKVLELDPQNRVANQGLEAILTSLADKAEKTLTTGDLEQAGKLVENIDTLFPNNRRVSEMRTKITTKERDIREQAEVQEFLGIAQRQIDEGKLIEPESDNALESFTQALNRQPDNAIAIKGLALIADRFIAQANEAVKRGEFATALKLADSGLLAAPDNAELLSIQAKSTGQLSARDQEIQSRLQEAQRLVLSGNFLPPGDNALDSFKNVEKMDPGNEQAARGLARLPDQVFEEASQLEKLGDFSGASELLEIAQKSFGNQPKFTEMQKKMEGSIAQQEKDELLQKLIEKSGNLVASQPLTLDVIDQAASTFNEINTKFPGNLTAAGQFDDFINAVSARARQVSAGGSEESGFVLVDRALSHYAGNQRLLDIRNALEKARDERLAEEARRLAALMGKLAIDAVPWGEVTEIRDAKGNTHELPGNLSTPLLVTLMAGDYTVSIRDGSGGSPQKLTVNVVAQQTAVATAQFDSLSADDYFERSNW
jgi:tetratricopeptide (TPR) repeat protein